MCRRVAASSPDEHLGHLPNGEEALLFHLEQPHLRAPRDIEHRNEHSFRVRVIIFAHRD